MNLIDNWREIVKRAHSMWAFYLSVICLILPDAIFYIIGVDTNPRLWWFLGLGLLIYGIIGRVWDQGVDDTKTKSPWIIGVLALVVVAAIAFGDWRVSDPKTASVSPPSANMSDVADRAFLEHAVPFVARWEGLRLEAYLDIVNVPTVCYGETKGVKLGDRYTKAQCDAMLGRELIGYRDGLHKFFTIETKRHRLPVARDVAFTSLAYNVGVTGAGKSTATRRLNAGNIAGACEALTWWNKAGGRVIRGLVNRRADERAWCMRGVA